MEMENDDGNSTVGDSGQSTGGDDDASGGIMAAALVVASVLIFGALAVATLVGAVIR